MEKIFYKMMSKSPKEYLIRVGRGAKVMESILSVCEKEKITAGTFTALGALRNARLGWYSVNKKKYHEITVDEEVELAGGVGNVATFEGKTVLHFHVVLGSTGRTYVAHLFEAEVEGTLEVFLRVWDTVLERAPDAEVGLNLLKL